MPPFSALPPLRMKPQFVKRPTLYCRRPADWSPKCAADAIPFEGQRECRHEGAALNASSTETNAMGRRSYSMIVSHKGQLALAAVLEIAAAPDGAPPSAKTLAAQEGLPPRYLEPVLRALVRDRILKSFRGPHGGYGLACDRKGVTVNDIVRAAGTEELPDGAPKSSLVAQVVRPLLSVVEEGCAQALSRISLDDMVTRAATNRQPNSWKRTQRSSRRVAADRPNAHQQRPFERAAPRGASAERKQQPIRGRLDTRIDRRRGSCPVRH